MATLLIYDYGEQELELFLIPGAPEWLTKCHGEAINGCYDDEIVDYMYRVQDAIYDHKEDDRYNNPGDPICRSWVKYKIDPKEGLPSGVSNIVITGMIP